MSPGNRVSRRDRVDKAYRLTLASGGFSVAAVAAFVLALVSSFSWGWFILLAVLAAVSTMLLRNSVR
jgi:type III secretory pathway component EscV